MTKNTKAPAPEVITESTEGRTKRKKVYQKTIESTLPEELHQHFKKQGYDLFLVRWTINGEEEYRYLHKIERKGYEFVEVSELPEWYLKGMRLTDTKYKKGLVTIGDLCLMKIDSDLRQSIVDSEQADTEREQAAVDIHNLNKKGFITEGTKSRVMLKDPSFAD